MFLIILSLFCWVCDHDSFADYLSSLPQEELVTVGKLKEISNKREPINIHYDFRLIENITLDPLACKEIGQLIKWGGKTRNCTETDLITPEKVKVVTETLTNAGKFFNSVLNVTKYSSFLLRGDAEHAVYPNTNTGDADLYLAVYAMPFGGKKSVTLASAGAYVGFYTTDNLEHRPQKGIVHINFALLPNYSSNIDSDSRGLYEVCTHETIHALGFAKDQYARWLNRTSKTPYANVTRIVTNPLYPKKAFNLFITPKLLVMFHNQFGYNEFAEGVEIEDGGTIGTAGSHFA